MWPDLEVEKDREMLTTPLLVHQQPCSWHLVWQKQRGRASYVWKVLGCIMRAQVKHAREFGQSLSLLKAKAGMASGHCVHAWDSFSSGNCRRQGSECCPQPPKKCGVTGAMNSTISPIAQQYTTSDCGYPANIFSWLKWWNLVQYKHIKVLQWIPWAWEMCFCRVWPD